MHQNRFRLLQRSPDPLAGFGDRFAAGGGAGLGKRREKGEEGEGGGSGGEEREGPQVTVELGPLRALLRHWVLITKAGSHAGQ